MAKHTSTKCRNPSEGSVKIFVNRKWVDLGECGDSISILNQYNKLRAKKIIFIKGMQDCVKDKCGLPTKFGKNISWKTSDNTLEEYFSKAINVFSHLEINMVDSNLTHKELNKLLSARCDSLLSNCNIVNIVQNARGGLCRKQRDGMLAWFNYLETPEGLKNGINILCGEDNSNEEYTFLKSGRDCDDGYKMYNNCDDGYKMHNFDGYKMYNDCLGDDEEYDFLEKRIRNPKTLEFDTFTVPKDWRDPLEKDCKFGADRNLRSFTGYVRPPMSMNQAERYTGMNTYRSHINSPGAGSGNPNIARSNSFYGSYPLGMDLNTTSKFGKKRRRRKEQTEEKEQKRKKGKKGKKSNK